MTRAKGLLLVPIMLSSSCSSILQTYNDTNLPESQLGSLYTSKIEQSENSIFAPLQSYIDVIYNESGEKVVESTNPLNGFVTEARLQPGSYMIQVKCARSNSYAFPMVGLKVNAGDELVIVCISDKKNLKVFGYNQEKKYAADVLTVEQFADLEFSELLKGKE